MTENYANISVLTETKERFIKRYKAAKKTQRRFYMDDFLNQLLDKDEGKV